MSGLFSPDVSEIDGDAVGFRVDPRHAYLADHRVGGRPLFSTVLSVELLASALVARHPGQVLAAVERIVVGPPLFVDRPLAAKVTIGENGPARFALQLGSDAGPHLSAELVVGPLPGPPELLPPSPVATGTCRGGVDAADIYALFFHGPAFRVVDRAWWSGDALVAELSGGRPDLRDRPPATVTAPLLTELCLQTAGLRELATRGVMNIPRSIDRIVRRSDRDVGDGGRLCAVVRPAGSAGDESCDAEVVDEHGHVQLEVCGYRTTPLAVPFDPAAAALVRDRLQPVRSAEEEL